MSYAGCACICNGDELALSGNLVVVADAGKGLLFRYTPNGTFAGFIGSAIDCKPSYPFKPTRIVWDGSQYHALNMAGKTIDTIGINGEQISSVSLLEAGLGSSTPTSLAYGNDMVFISFNNGTMVACDYELTISYKTTLTDVISMFFWSDKLYALTAKGTIQIYDSQLNALKSPLEFTSLPSFLKDPQDIFVDQSENIWIADTGNKRVVVFWSDGGFSTWGETAKSYESKEMAGNPISGKNISKLTPRRIVALDDFFFISTPDHQSFSIPIENLSKKQFFGSKHHMSLRMSLDKYRKHQQNLWELQQDMYPQTAVLVTIDNQNESVYINGKRIDASIEDVCGHDGNLSCFLENVDGKTDESLKHYIEQGYLVFERETVANEIQIVVVEKMSGANNPLQSEPVGRVAIMPQDLKASIKLPKPQIDSVFVASVFDNNGKFLDLFFVR